MTATLHWVAWSQFDPDTLYALLKLRSEVFVVEQACLFSDMDGLDAECLHLIARDAHGAVVGCVRRVPPHLKRPHTPAPAFDGPALGRLVVAPAHRSAGLGRALMQEGIARCTQDFPDRALYLSAQQQLEAFYASLGFTRIGEPYDEDGIIHVDMCRQWRPFGT